LVNLTPSVEKGSFMHTAPAPSGTLTSLAGTAMGVDWRIGFLMWTVASQYINLCLVLWTILVPEASRGILGFVERDLRLPTTLIAVLCLFSIGITWRGLHPRWWLLWSLLGQGVIATIAMLYTIRSDITLTQFAGHGGVFFLSGLGIVSMIPLDIERMGWRNRVIIASKRLLIPTIGIALLFYAIGLATRPDAGIAMFIQSQFGTPLIVILVGVLAVSAAVVVQNHISAGRLFVALLPQAIYAVMAVALLAEDIGVSLVGIFVHTQFLITALFVVLIQTKEHARTLMLRARRGA
jgi:hypothetical protein